MRVMLDTDTCIFAMSHATGFVPRTGLRDCGISVVVLGELEWGVRRSTRVRENQASLQQWLAAINVVQMDEEVARHYGQLRADLNRIGPPIGPNDLWIAAHALALAVPLITNNLAEFERVPGLVAETWMTER
ncbi:MAG: type II toxin-antitoxin system VapC family toxin [Gammaproteobacteria bacterium]|nr:type II toxin-antitoxin system VapC family toxin [Gammaproteobacteria bacterium]